MENHLAEDRSAKRTPVSQHNVRLLKIGSGCSYTYQQAMCLYIALHSHLPESYAIELEELAKDVDSKDKAQLTFNADSPQSRNVYSQVTLHLLLLQAALIHRLVHVTAS